MTDPTTAWEASGIPSDPLYKAAPEPLRALMKFAFERGFQAQRAEGAPLLLATEKGLTPLGKLIDACQAMLRDINYTRGLAEGSVGKGAGNRMADALDELLPSMNKESSS